MDSKGGGNQVAIGQRKGKLDPLCCEDISVTKHQHLIDLMKSDCGMVLEMDDGEVESCCWVEGSEMRSLGGRMVLQACMVRFSSFILLIGSVSDSCASGNWFAVQIRRGLALIRDTPCLNFLVDLSSLLNFVGDADSAQKCLLAEEGS